MVSLSCTPACFSHVVLHHHSKGKLGTFVSRKPARERERDGDLALFLAKTPARERERERERGRLGTSLSKNTGQRERERERERETEKRGITRESVYITLPDGGLPAN